MRDQLLVSEDRADRDRWLAIELRHLAALATVARQASFSGAAETLGYVQSAVSQQIRALERIVGRRLVDRSARPHSVTVTAAGEALLDHVDDILEQLRLAKADVDALDEDVSPAVSFGVDVIFGSRLPAIVLGALMPDSGGGGWQTVERGPGPKLLQRVATGDLDAAFVPLPIASGPFFAMELLREPSVLLAPAAAVASGMDVEAMLEEWPVVRIADCTATSELLERYAGCPGPARPLHIATSPVSALPLVRSGVAVAVMPSTEVPDDDTTVATVPLPDLPDRVTGLAWHRDHYDRAEIDALRTAVRRAFRDLAVDGGASLSPSAGAGLDAA